MGKACTVTVHLLRKKPTVS